LIFFLNSALSKRTSQWFCSLLHCCFSDNDNIDGSNSILPQNVTVYWVVIIFPVLPTAGKKLCVAVLRNVKDRNHFSLAKTKENQNTNMERNL